MLNRENIGILLIGLLLGAAFGIGGLALTNRARPAPILIATPPPTLTPTPTATPLPTATPGPITVHVNGAVAAPGIYQLPPDSIVETAVSAAGGFESDANTSVVNLAQPLGDGVQVYIPALIENPATPATSVIAADTTSGTATDVTFGVESETLVDINQAAAAELETLPGVGPSTAASIIQYRTENGPFASVEELLDVTGIGPAKFEQMRDFITIGP